MGESGGHGLPSQGKKQDSSIYDLKFADVIPSYYEFSFLTIYPEHPRKMGSGIN